MEASFEFEKYLKRVDIKKQMVVPSDFIPHLPRYEWGRTIMFPVHDVSGKVWNFGYYIRREGKDYPKPVFQGGWRNYVGAKGLSIGDKIIFRVEPNGANGAPRYSIAAQKSQFFLLGTPIWTPEF